jgi:hypothetical protein
MNGEVEHDFDYTLGRSAKRLASIPNRNGSGESTLWSQAEMLHIALGAVRRNGDQFEEKAEITIPIRTERAEAAPPTGDAFIRAARENRDILPTMVGPDLDDYPAVVRQATRVFLIAESPHAKRDRLLMQCSSVDSSGTPVSRNVSVWVQRRGRSSLFIGPLTLLPDGDPPPIDGAPFVVLPAGRGWTDCRLSSP